MLAPGELLRGANNPGVKESVPWEILCRCVRRRKELEEGGTGWIEKYESEVRREKEEEEEERKGPLAIHTESIDGPKD